MVMFLLICVLLQSCTPRLGNISASEITDSLYISDSTFFNSGLGFKPNPIDSYLLYKSNNISMYYIYPKNSDSGFCYVYSYRKSNGEKRFKKSIAKNLGDTFAYRQKVFLDSLRFVNIIDTEDRDTLLLNIFCSWHINVKYLSRFGYFDQMQKTLLRLKNLKIADDSLTIRKIKSNLKGMTYWRKQPYVNARNFHNKVDFNSAEGKLFKSLEWLSCDNLCGLYNEFERRKLLVIKEMEAIELNNNEYLVLMLPELMLFIVDLNNLTRRDIITYDSSYDSLETNILRLQMGYYISKSRKKHVPKN